MKENNFELISKDGLKLKGRHWAAPQPKASILMVHGIGEHIGRYEHVAHFFNRHDIDFFGFDLRGHGRSEGKAGHAPSYDYLLDDLNLALTHVIKTNAKSPVFLYGHSFGGNIVANYILKNMNAQLKGAIIASAWLRLSEEPGSAAQQMARAVSRIYPSYTQPHDININYLSQDKEVISAYKPDPLVHNMISMKLYVDTHDAGLEVLQRAGEINIPMLVMHGDEDQVTSPEGSKALALRAGKNSDLKLWANDKHELHNEPDHEEILMHVLLWMEKLL